MGWSKNKNYLYRRAGLFLPGYKTLHKIAVRSYKQPFGGKILKKVLQPTTSGMVTYFTFKAENIKNRY